jgi:thioester reductase-like protein
VQRQVFLTGGTGFLGKVVLEALLRRRAELGIERVVLLIRAPSAAIARARLEASVLASPCFSKLDPGWQKVLAALPGDICEARLGLEAGDANALHARLTHVIHCAASIDFDLPLPEAARVNALGALELLELARCCEKLERCVSVSTAYVTPHPRNAGAFRVEERLAPLRGPLAGDPERLLEACLADSPAARETQRASGHPNSYTFTKCLAEQLLAARRGSVPLAIVRPSIISASLREPFPGWIDSHAAFAATVALMGTGQLRAVAADPAARVDLVPVDAVAERVLGAAFGAPRSTAPGEPEILHAVSGSAGQVSVAQCQDAILGFFSRYRAGRGPQLRHVGPIGLGFALRSALHQELPARAAALLEGLRGRPRQRRALIAAAERLAQVNRSFAYFTHHSFDFRSSRPLPAEFSGPDYLRTICRGVHDHLLRLDSRETPLALRGSRKLLQRLRAEPRISFDLESFDAAAPALAAAERVLLVPSRADRRSLSALRMLRRLRPDLGLASSLLCGAGLAAERLRRVQRAHARACVLPIAIAFDAEPEPRALHLRCARAFELGRETDVDALVHAVAEELTRAGESAPRARRRARGAREPRRGDE